MENIQQIVGQPAEQSGVQQVAVVEGQTVIQHMQGEGIPSDGNQTQTVQIHQAEDGTISYTVETVAEEENENEQVILQIHHVDSQEGEEGGQAQTVVHAEAEEDEGETQNYVIDVSSLLAAGAGHGQIVQMANGQFVQLVRTEDGVQALQLEETPEGLRVVQHAEGLQITATEESMEGGETHMITETEDGRQVIYQVEEPVTEQEEKPDMVTEEEVVNMVNQASSQNVTYQAVPATKEQVVVGENATTSSHSVILPSGQVEQQVTTLVNMAEVQNDSQVTSGDEVRVTVVDGQHLEQEQTQNVNVEQVQENSYITEAGHSAEIMAGVSEGQLTMQVEASTPETQAVIQVEQVTEAEQAAEQAVEQEEDHNVIHVNETISAERDEPHVEDSNSVADICQYVCPQCKETTTDRKAFLDHLKTHTGIQVKTLVEHCDICGVGVESKRMLQEHMEEAHKNWDPTSGKVTGTYPCSVCLAHCVTPEDRDRHIQEKHFPCKICNSVLATQIALTKHNTWTHNCACGFIALNRQELLKHSETEHQQKKPIKKIVYTKSGPVPVKRKPGQEGEEALEVQTELFRDMRAPAKKLKSGPQYIVVKNKVEDENSTNSVAPKLSFVCSVCGGRYNNATALRTHFTNTHCCSVCGKVCATSGELKMHMSMQHKKDKAPKGVTDKPHKCLKCPASFADEKNLQRHQNSHLDNKVYEHMCHICGRGFEGYMVARFKHHVESHFK